MEFRQMVKEFLRDCEFSGKTQKTIASYAYALKVFGDWLERMGVDYTRPNGELREFRNYLVVEKQMKPKSVNLIISALSSFYEYLVSIEILPENPIRKKKLRVKEEQSLPRYLTDEEVEKIRSFFQNKPKRVRLAFDAMLFAGLRLGEVTQLRGGDVVEINNRVFFKVMGKGKKERLAPIVNKEVAREVLLLAHETSPEEKLFVGYSDLHFWARKCRLLTGVNLSPHKLRHTFATRLLQKGVGLDVIQEALGHTSIITTRKYARTTPERLFRLAEAWC